jgi:hypothetical protein
MTKAKNEAQSMTAFVKAAYPPVSLGRLTGMKVVASRSNFKWMSCSNAVVCSHAVTDAPTAPTRKAFADYLVSASADAEDDGAEDDGADDDVADDDGADDDGAYD